MTCAGAGAATPAPAPTTTITRPGEGKVGGTDLVGSIVTQTVRGHGGPRTADSRREAGAAHCLYFYMSLSSRQPLVFAPRVSYNTCMAKKTNKTQKLLTEFLEYLEIEKGRSQRTLRNYDFYLQRFLDWAKNPAPEKITLDMVRKFRLWLNRNIEGL